MRTGENDFLYRSQITSPRLLYFYSELALKFLRHFLCLRWLLWHLSTPEEAVFGLERGLSVSPTRFLNRGCLCRDKLPREGSSGLKPSEFSGSRGWSTWLRTRFQQYEGLDCFHARLPFTCALQPPMAPLIWSVYRHLKRNLKLSLSGSLSFDYGVSLLNSANSVTLQRTGDHRRSGTSRSE